MISRAARNQVERILTYISQQERKCCWSGTSEAADALRLAWWTVWFAAYQESTLPFDAALRKVLGPRYATYMQSRNVEPIAHVASDPYECCEVDGRNGSQWVRSVLAYLDWRSGDSWRPAQDRNRAERRTYTDASLCLRQSFFHPQPAFTPNKKSQPSKSPASSPRADRRLA